jgi:hypothetical protein
MGESLSVFFHIYLIQVVFTWLWMQGPEQNALGNLLVLCLLGGIFCGAVLDWVWLIGKGWWSEHVGSSSCRIPPSGVWIAIERQAAFGSSSADDFTSQPRTFLTSSRHAEVYSFMDCTVVWYHWCAFSVHLYPQFCWPNMFHHHQVVNRWKERLEMHFFDEEQRLCLFKERLSSAYIGKKRYELRYATSCHWRYLI